MKYTFEIVDIIAFDVHTSVPPLVKPDSVAAEFQFLFDAGAYASQHRQAKPFSVRGLTLEALASQKFQSSHFWRRCASIYHDGVLDPWKLQIPFHCNVPKVSVEFAPSLANTRAVLVPSIYLSSMGWSTSFHVRIFGAMTASDLFDLIFRFRNKASFVVEKSVKTLSQVFSRFSEIMKENIYVPPPPLFDRTTTQRHILLSPARFKASLASKAHSPLSDADFAEMHSMLLGRRIGIPELATNQAKQNFLRVEYDDSDFALTYFELGTLLWMEEGSRPRTRSALWCLASNVGACSMYALTLADYLKSTEHMTSPAQRIQLLRDSIPFTISELGSAYTNPFCRAFLRSHKDLRALAR